mmetsp:Transcript_133690/g.303253  ORF Transcript_133690/g.303253 Transcript_133690/m.303253 type:complete len:234 (+) Transcript_133690:200-901(+)
MPPAALTPPSHMPLRQDPWKRAPYRDRQSLMLEHSEKPTPSPPQPILQLIGQSNSLTTPHSCSTFNTAQVVILLLFMGCTTFVTSAQVAAGSAHPSWQATGQNSSAKPIVAGMLHMLCPAKALQVGVRRPASWEKMARARSWLMHRGVLGPQPMWQVRGQSMAAMDSRSSREQPPRARRVAHVRFCPFNTSAKAPPSSLIAWDRIIPIPALSSAHPSAGVSAHIPQELGQKSE